MQSQVYSNSKGHAIVLERHIQNTIEKIRCSELKADEKIRLLNLIAYEVHEISKLVP